MKNNKLFSPKQVAFALGVSEASIKRWVDKGLIECIKTDGGHRKIPLYSILHYITENNIELINPGVFEIPVTTGRLKDKVEKFADELCNAFRQCDEQKVQGLIFDIYTSGQKPEAIFDELVVPALKRLSQDWQDGEVDAFQQRRTEQICLKLLYGFNNLFPFPSNSAPIAILGTLSKDTNMLASLMMEICLRSLGWRTEFLGTDLSSASYTKAVSMYKPDVLVINISKVSDELFLIEELKKLEKLSRTDKFHLIIGGEEVLEKFASDLKQSFVSNSHFDFMQIIQNLFQALNSVENAQFFRVN